MNDPVVVFVLTVRLFIVVLGTVGVQTAADLFHIAPMQGYTNLYLRQFYRMLSPSAVLWTEMEKVEDLLAKSPEMLHRKLQYPAAQHPLVLQLGGNKEQSLSKAVQLAIPYGYNDINLNCGCPSIEAGGADFGAALLQQPKLTNRLLNSMATARFDSSFPQMQLPEISIKLRIAVYETLPDDYHSSYDQYEVLHRFLTEAIGEVDQAQCATHIVLHVRAAVLQGLSPAKNRMVPSLRPEFAEQLAADFPDLRITLNGGINSLHTLNEYMIKSRSKHGREAYLDGFMAGRWMLQRPLDLWHVQQMMLNISSSDRCTELPSLDSSYTADGIRAAIQKYNQFCVDNLSRIISGAERGTSPSSVVSSMLLPYYLVVMQLKEEEEIDNDMNSLFHATSERYDADTILSSIAEGVYTILGMLSNEHSFERELATEFNISKVNRLLKKTVGTKVFNKWKRNRKECG